MNYRYGHIEKKKSLKCQKRLSGDDSVIKSTSFSFRGPHFNSQHPQVGCQTPPVPDNSTPSVGLCGYWTCTYCIDTHAAKTLKGIKTNRLKNIFKN